MTSSTTADDLSSHRTRTNVRSIGAHAGSAVVGTAETSPVEPAARELVGA